jgi:hypothetical protein
MDAIEIGRRTLAPRSAGAAEGWPSGGQRTHPHDELGGPATYEPPDYRVSARQIVGAWLILFGVAGLGLALTTKHMDLASSASGAPVQSAVNAAAIHPTAGVRYPGSVFYSRAKETRVEADEPDRQERQWPAEDGC